MNFESQSGNTLRQTRMTAEILCQASVNLFDTFKMFYHTFDDQKYTCVPFNLDSYEIPDDFWGVVNNIEDDKPCVRPEELTVDWVANEILKACSRDMKDSFYTENQNNMHGLEDVVIPEGDVLLIFNQAGYLVGKIQVHADTKANTLNVMYIYVFGDRRRSIPRQTGSARKYINGPYIIWYFVALFAKELFGNTASVLVTLPRDTVFKQLSKAGALFVKLGGKGFITSNVEDRSLEYHKRYVEWMTNDGPHEGLDETGALFSAIDLARHIEDFEAQAATLRQA